MKPVAILSFNQTVKKSVLPKKTTWKNKKLLRRKLVHKKTTFALCFVEFDVILREIFKTRLRTNVTWQTSQTRDRKKLKNFCQDFGCSGSQSNFFCQDLIEAGVNGTFSRKNFSNFSQIDFWSGISQIAEKFFSKTLLKWEVNGIFSRKNLKKILRLQLKREVNGILFPKLTLIQLKRAVGILSPKLTLIQLKRPVNVTSWAHLFERDLKKFSQIEAELNGFFGPYHRNIFFESFFKFDTKVDESFANLANELLYIFPQISTKLQKTKKSFKKKPQKEKKEHQKRKTQKNLNFWEKKLPKLPQCPKNVLVILQLDVDGSHLVKPATPLSYWRQQLAESGRTAQHE